MLRVGDKAPPFAGKDASGNALSLEGFAGTKKVVLYFYPKDFTPGCTKEACSFRDAWDELSGKDTIVIGVSRDDESSHRDFANKHRLPFPLLASRTTVRRQSSSNDEKTLAAPSRSPSVGQARHDEHRTGAPPLLVSSAKLP